MNEHICMLFADLVGDLQTEGIHIAFVALVGGAGLLSSAFTWLLRRDLRRRDEDHKAIAAEVVELRKEVDKNKDRHGYEIGDIKVAVAPLFTKAGLESPIYPSR